MSERIHYLDNLRALAMLLGVYLHAAFAYAQPAQTVWLATDTQSSVFVDGSIWLIHLFRMSLFFWLSGYFGKLVWQRQGTAQFVKQRLLRLAVPFILLYPFLLMAITAIIVFSLAYLESPRGLMGLIAGAIAANDQSQQQPWSLMHLWFLYYLLLFSLLAPVLARSQLRMIAVLFDKARYWLLLPLMLVPGAALAGSPLPAPESFIPELWPFAFYGIYYWAGWQTVGREQQLMDLQNYIWPVTGLSAMLFIPYYWFMPEMRLELWIDGPMELGWARTVALSLLTAYLSASLTLAALLWGQRCLGRHSGGMRFLADAAYWIYLVHLPIVLFMQTLLLPLNWALSIKLGLVLAVSMVFCMASYIVFVRYTPLGWLLHGKRAFP